MPPASAPTVLRRPEREREPLPEALTLALGGGQSDPTMEDGALKTELPDGGAVIDFAPQTKAKSDKFDANLALEMDDGELSRIAMDLLQGIEADNQSRTEWLSTHEAGIKLLGLVIEGERTGDSSSAPLEGMSTARHPLLLEAVLLFQANARGELLPASGPVKVRDDRPNKPDQQQPPGMGHNGGPPMAGASPFNPASPALPPGAGAPGGLPQPPLPAAGTPPLPKPPPQPSMVPGLPMPQPGDDVEDDRDAFADALEKDFNHYLTTTAKEYYPDTDRMLFSVGFGGQGVKKVYNCPLRRRPVSESIAMEDFIVSNAMTDLANCARITHRIKMRPSVVKRMQLLSVYRDVPLGTPQQTTQPNAVDQTKAEVSGVQPNTTRPEDADFELYEVYCELVLDDYAPAKFKAKGLALPFRVTIEKDSQQILEVRRNWRKDDAECMAKEFFVEFPYDKAFGFYGIGLLHILGNTTKTLTAAWRELIDSGMFANFPGFIYAKGAGRQLTNQFRVAPGSGIGLDVGLAKLSDAVMPLPYKDLGPAFTAFIAHVEELGQRVGGTANITIGEGRADAPVGTTLALIEQATKPIGAVLKRLHSAQSKEIQLLGERFKDDPEAFWRFNKRPAMPWQRDQFVKALNDFDLVPVSDPNNPTKLHRAAKSAALQQIAKEAPGLLDPRKVFKRVCDSLEIPDGDDLFAPIMPPQAPPAPPPDPSKLANAQAKMKGDELRAGTEREKAQIGAQDKREARASRIRELELRAEIEREKREGMIEAAELKLAATVAGAAEKTEQADRHKEAELLSTHARDLHGQEQEHQMADMEREHGAGQTEADRAHEAEQADAQRKHDATQAEKDRKHALTLERVKARNMPKAAAKPKVKK